MILVVKTAAIALPVTPNHSGGMSKLMGRSCAEARAMDPALPSGDYYVDPDGVNIGDDPISVYCDMSTGIKLHIIHKILQHVLMFLLYMIQ